MRSSRECVPCLMRQALESAGASTMDEGTRQETICRIRRVISELDFGDPPPAAVQKMNRLLCLNTGGVDLYREAKERYNDMALELYPAFLERIAASPDPFAGAVLLAIAGNVIDLGAKADLTEREAFDAMERALDESVAGDIDEFRKEAQAAERILYLADNAGEIVFDRALIGMLPAGRVTVAVRGKPVINDATMADAVTAGIPDMAPVIDNGSDAPGTVLEDCSPKFIDVYRKADLVVSKGQGNYETLSEEKKNIFFLLKIKCPVVASHSGLALGTHALIRSRL